MAAPDNPLRVLFAAPAYWPATAFGGPIPVLRSLATGLAGSGHAVDVVTTSLTTAHGPRSRRTRTELQEGSTIRYLATPVSYRWMGVTPTLPLWLERLPRPDVAHIFGFRDPVGTIVATWCLARGIPYVFEALGMFRPKLRKVGLKRALDASVYHHVPARAARLLACSAIERDEYVAGGVERSRIALRPNGFPAVTTAPPGALRARLALPSGTPLVVAVGRVADGKGLDLLVRSVPDLPGAHLAIVGPDDGHGTAVQLTRLMGGLGVAERVHLVGQLADDDVQGAYADADVVALASAHENFGMVAAEAAAAGRAILLTDRCGVAELLGGRGALVVPYEGAAISEGLRRLLADGPLRARLGQGARETARIWSWQTVVDLQTSVYEDILGARARAGAAAGSA